MISVLAQECTISPEREVEALRFGVNAAGTMAERGRLGSELYINQEAKRLETSILGAAELKRLGRTIKEYTPLKGGAYGKLGELTVCIAPSLDAGVPVRIVGLGDTFTAAAFYKLVL